MGKGKRVKKGSVCELRESRFVFRERKEREVWVKGKGRV